MVRNGDYGLLRRVVWGFTCATREKGCLNYVISADVGDEGLFHLFEEWESQEALDAHFKSPHMATFQKSLGSLGVKELKVLRYEVSSVGPLGG